MNIFLFYKYESRIGEVLRVKVDDFMFYVGNLTPSFLSNSNSTCSLGKNAWAWASEDRMP